MAGNAPIIIKKVKKVQGGGHHGGAWKVAYADFVTAMMAFFLLLWLLSTTSEEQKEGIADYFDQRIPVMVNTGGGESVFNGDSVTASQSRSTSGKADNSGSDNPADKSAEAAAQSDKAGEGETGATGAKDAEMLEAIQQAFRALSGESEAADEMLRHIRTRVTPEGLVIDVFDVEDSPLFAPGTAQPTDKLRGLLAMVASVAELVTNAVSVTGHTDAGAPAADAADDANWPLSSDRAHAARRLMVGSGLDAGRVRSVAGRAATEPMIADAADPRNRRIEITLLRDRPAN
jgi:chemotaxis protein MotB